MTLAPRIDTEQEFTNNLQSRQLAKSQCVGRPVYRPNHVYKLATRYIEQLKQHTITPTALLVSKAANA